MTHPHILLISLETMRRDHLRIHGYPKDLCPHLDRLAREGVCFTDAVANSGWTLPQNITMHTGLYPLTHDLTLMREQHPIYAEQVTLAEHLRAHGYRTFAGVNARNPYSAHAKYGFDRGFDEHLDGAAYNQHMAWTEGFVLSRLAAHHQEAPCFVYVHINDTHEPWDAPEPWRNMWGASYHNRYEGEISYVDHYLGRLFFGLRELGIWEQTLIVIHGDHGTELWEHGFTEKKVNLYNEILHVPWIMRGPSLPKGIRVPGLCESAQMAPTILDAAGLPPLPDAQGTSLLPRIRGRKGSLSQVFSHTRHEHQREGGPVQFEHFAVQTPRWKFIRLHLYVEPEALHSDWARRMATIALRAGISPDRLGPGAVIRELYDLELDPGEGRNLLVEPTEEVSAMAQGLEETLDAWISRCIAARPEQTA
jgi:arylsulfatase A-like enzyme